MGNATDVGQQDIGVMNVTQKIRKGPIGIRSLTIKHQIRRVVGGVTTVERPTT